MNIERCTGIYGIYVNDELVYIGKTLNSFAKRFDNHNYYMRHSDKGSQMYKDLSLLKKAGNHIYMKPLVILEELKVNRIISKIEILENKLEIGKTMSEAYRKMQTTALMEDCKSLQNEVTKTRKVDSRKLETFGKILATAKSFVENYIDDKCALVESSNPLLNKIIKEEKEAIKNIL